MSVQSSIHQMKPISETPLFMRVSRALRRVQGQTLHRCRENSKWFNSVGRYYTTDDHNRLRARGLDLLTLEEWGREFGVLKSDESVAD